MPRRIDRRQKPAWQKVRKPNPQQPRKKSKGKTAPSRKKLHSGHA